MPKRVRIISPELWQNPKAQADQYRAINSPARISLMATGTKCGKTLSGAIWAVRKATKKSRGWWVAPFRKTASIGYKRVQSLLPQGHFDTNDSEMTIHCHNGTVIEFRTADNPDGLFGEAVDWAVGDEVPRWKAASWTAVNTTMLQTQGPMRLFGNTDKGRRNFFYKLFLQGKSGQDPDIASFHIRTTEAPHFMAGGFPGPIAIERFRKNLSPIDFEAFILAEFPEDGATAFPGLSRCIVFDFGGQAFGEPPFLLPPFDGCLPVGGLDLANRRNFTVITVLDARTGVIMYWERMRGTTWKEQVTRVREVQEIYGCPFLVDATHGSVGDPILERLQEDGVIAEGFEFKSTTKNWLVESLQMAVANVELMIPSSLTVLITELESLERELSLHGNIRYHAPEGEGIDAVNDDSVFSLALAQWHRRSFSTIEIAGTAPRHPERGGLMRAGYLGGR